MPPIILEDLHFYKVSRGGRGCARPARPTCMALCYAERAAGRGPQGGRRALPGPGGRRKVAAPLGCPERNPRCCKEYRCGLWHTPLHPALAKRRGLAGPGRQPAGRGSVRRRAPTLTGPNAPSRPVTSRGRGGQAMPCHRENTSRVKSMGSVQIVAFLCIYCFFAFSCI